MPILPIRNIPPIVEMPYSTCPTIFKGQVLTVSAAGYLTNTLVTTSSPVAGVAAEQKSTASALSSANLIKIWPARDTVLWEATSSGTPAEAGVGSVCAYMNNQRGVIYSATAVTTGGTFVIEAIDSANTKLKGRINNSLIHGRRTPGALGTT